MTYMLKITGQVLCGFHISPKGFIPSVLGLNLIFLESLEKSSWLRSKCFWILMDHSSNGIDCVTVPIATEMTVAMGI
jgi:hypothetical protein